MLVIHNDPRFSSRMPRRLRTTSMGLGLVRLLLDAGRAAEARDTLVSLQHGLQWPEPTDLVIGEAARGLGPI